MISKKYKKNINKKFKKNTKINRKKKMLNRKATGGAGCCGWNDDNEYTPEYTQEDYVGRQINEAADMYGFPKVEEDKNALLNRKANIRSNNIYKAYLQSSLERKTLEINQIKLYANVLKKILEVLEKYDTQKEVKKFISKYLKDINYNVKLLNKSFENFKEITDSVITNQSLRGSLSIFPSIFQPLSYYITGKTKNLKNIPVGIISTAHNIQKCIENLTKIIQSLRDLKSDHYNTFKKINILLVQPNIAEDLIKNHKIKMTEIIEQQVNNNRLLNVEHIINENLEKNILYKILWNTIHSLEEYDKLNEQEKKIRDDYNERLNEHVQDINEQIKLAKENNNESLINDLEYKLSSYHNESLYEKLPGKMPNPETERMVQWAKQRKEIVREHEPFKDNKKPINNAPGSSADHAKLGGRKTRKIKRKNLRKSGSKSKNSAVKKIQSLYRNKKTKKIKNKAATKIQTKIRGTISRKECSICQMPGAHFKTKCNHYFHKKCLKKWCKSKKGDCTCPLCRKVLVEQDLKDINLTPLSLEQESIQLEEIYDKITDAKNQILFAKVIWDSSLSTNFLHNNIERSFNELILNLNRAKENLNPDIWTNIISFDSDTSIEIIDAVNEILTSIQIVKNSVLNNQKPNIENTNKITELLDEQYDRVTNILSMMEENNPETF